MPNTYTEACEAAYLKVFDDKSPTDWCTLGYEGRKLVPTGEGEGGLAELKEQFEDSAIAYALLRKEITDDGGDSKRTKFIMLVWCAPRPRAPQPLRGSQARRQRPSAARPPAPARALRPRPRRGGGGGAPGRRKEVRRGVRGGRGPARAARVPPRPGPVTAEGGRQPDLAWRLRRARGGGARGRSGGRGAPAAARTGRHGVPLGGGGGRAGRPVCCWPRTSAESVGGKQPGRSFQVAA